MLLNDQYIFLFDNGRIVVGVIYENDVDFDDLCVIVGGQYEVLSKVLVLVLGFVDVVVIEIRVGFRLFILGFLLVVGVVLDVKGFFVVNGLGVLGLMMGLFLGLEFVKLVFGKQIEIDFSFYDIVGVLYNK